MEGTNVYRTSTPKRREKGILKTRRNRQILELTPSQAELLEWAVRFGLVQFEEHLLHDDWDSQLSTEDRAGTLSDWRNMKLALQLLTGGRK